MEYLDWTLVLAWAAFWGAVAAPIAWVLSSPDPEPEERPRTDGFAVRTVPLGMLVGLALFVRYAMLASLWPALVMFFLVPPLGGGVGALLSLAIARVLRPALFAIVVAGWPLAGWWFWWEMSRLAG